jgi:hypothetical protein
VRDRAILPTLLYTGSVYHNIVRKYGLETGVRAEMNGFVRALVARNSRHERAFA